MAKDNLTAILYGINDLRLEQRPIPVPNEHQVLLQIEVVGICGSDVHYLVNGRIANMVVESPMVMGHEASGTVVEVGSKVKNLKVGDRVAIEPSIPCRRCDYCRSGSYHLCPELFFCATPPHDGNLARYYVHDADFCFKLPCNVDFEEGVLVEPLSVGVRACKQAKVKIGDNVLVTGCGTIGLATLLAAKAMGAAKVIITDIMDFRLNLAKQLGATYTVNVKGLSEDDYVNKILQVMKGEEIDACVDACGAEIGNRVASRVLKKGGIVIFVGMLDEERTIPFTFAMIKEVQFRGVFRYCNDYPTSIEMVRSGEVDIKQLITHHFTLEDTLKAFETARTQSGDPIKILIHCNPNWKPS